MTDKASSLQPAASGKFFLDPAIPAEHETHLYQRLYQELVIMHHELTGGLTADGFFVCKNKNLVSFLLGDTRGASFFSFVHPDDLSLVKDLFAMLSDQNPEISFECRMIPDAGDIRWIAWRVRICTDIYAIRYLILGHDVTDDDRWNGFLENYRKSVSELVQSRNHHLRIIQDRIMEEIVRRQRIENTLNTLIFEVESEVLMLKEVVRNAPDILFVFDRDGNLLHLNSRGADYLGSPIHSLIGRNKNELGLSPAIENLLSSGDALPAAQAAPQHGVVTTGKHTYTYYLRPLQDNDGITSAILLILFDKMDLIHQPFQIQGSFFVAPAVIGQRITSSVTSLFNILRQNIVLARR